MPRRHMLNMRFVGFVAEVIVGLEVSSSRVSPSLG